MEQFNQFTLQKSDVVQQLKQLKNIMVKLEEVGIDSADTLQKIEHAIHNVQDDTLRIALLGAFSDGKTSVIAGWLGQVMGNMIIDSDESSNELAFYRPDNLPEKCEIVDTPGLFGDKERQDDRGNTIQYSDLTCRYISEAHLIFYVVDAVNPLKESHKETVQWILRDLNKLSSTIFIINKMDAVADLRDDEEFEERSKIKKDNLLGKLDRFIQLTEEEKRKINIVCLASNPNGRGLEEFWFGKKALYEERSRINHLKTVTNRILSSTARESLVSKTGLDVVKDIIVQNLSLAEQQYAGIDLYIKDVTNSIQTISYDLEQTRKKFIASRQYLLNDLNHKERDLLGYVDRLSIETINSFIDTEIGNSNSDAGYKLRLQIENICQKHFGYVVGVMQNTRLKIDHQLNLSEQYANSLEKKFLGASQTALKRFSKLPAPTIKSSIFAGRDMLSKVGINIKFKPWGATKLAGNLSKGVAVVAVAIELYGMYSEQEQRQKAEQELIKTKGDLRNLIQDHFQAVYENLIDDNVAIANFIPDFLSLTHVLNMQKNELQELRKNKTILEQINADFKSVQKQGLITNTVFSGI